MGQKYTFFIKGSSVTFSADEASGRQFHDGEGPVGDTDILTLWQHRIKGMHLDRDYHVVVNDLPGFIGRLFSAFPVIQAAGGYVLNANGQLLMIFRRGYWDLPKGKIEEGEVPEQAALREVEEECGIDRLQITSGPFDTYHVYAERGETIIKQSIWYRMYTDTTAVPVPQEEEDIVEVRWVNLPVPREILSGAYASIHAVIEHFSHNT